MTDREAIKALKLEGGLEISGKPKRVAEFLEGLSVAESALQERIDREKGCEYCKESKDIYQVKSELHDSMNEDVYVSGDALVVDIGCHSYGTAEIRFCPMCGRKLKTAMPEEETTWT